ncbi:hypothetical protein PR048_027980 [Dryococelus australis]|uniref:Uncharacterized protein n=1 Tax=Dryococelus australis TaxID=614101 RepID=A0ABQ9GI04_9NEOP|nr:hypothetical protein PR048_027980 [Dryococelus australis]
MDNPIRNGNKNARPEAKESKLAELISVDGLGRSAHFTANGLYLRGRYNDPRNHSPRQPIALVYEILCPNLLQFLAGIPDNLPCKELYLVLESEGKVNWSSLRKSASQEQHCLARLPHANICRCTHEGMNLACGVRGLSIDVKNGLAFSPFLFDFSNLATLHEETFQNLSSLRELVMRETTSPVSPGVVLAEEHFRTLGHARSLPTLLYTPSLPKAHETSRLENSRSVAGSGHKPPVPTWLRQCCNSSIDGRYRRGATIVSRIGFKLRILAIRDHNLTYHERITPKRETIPVILVQKSKRKPFGWQGALRKTSFMVSVVLHLRNETNIVMLGQVNMREHLDEGHRRSVQKHNELSTESENPSVFRGLLEFVAILDNVVRDHLENSNIFKADETTDISCTSQMFIVIRYNFKDSIFERFWGYLFLTDPNADGISSVILELLRNLGVDKNQKNSLRRHMTVQL